MEDDTDDDAWQMMDVLVYRTIDFGAVCTDANANALVRKIREADVCTSIR